MNDDISKRLARLPRRNAPPELIAQLKADYIGPSFLEQAKTFFRTAMLRPAGVMAVVAVLVGWWFYRQNAQENQFVDMEPLLAAHSRYEGESLAPQADLAHSNYSIQLASYYKNEN